jgi:hypothetical protein
VRLESGKGELGIFIIGEDNIFPWRWKIRAADFHNLSILPHLLKGHRDFASKRSVCNADLVLQHFPAIVKYNLSPLPPFRTNNVLHITKKVLYLVDR